MRHIFFCAAIAIVAVSSTALSAAQNRGPVGQYAAYTLSAGAEVDVNGNNYPSTNASYDSFERDCGYESGCESGCGCGCGLDWRERAATSGFIAGFEFLWLKPHFSYSNNYQQYIVNSDLLNRSSLTQEYGLSADYELAPRVWIGYQLCSGLSARLRYWQFDQKIDSRTLESTDEISLRANSWWGEVIASDGGVMEIKNSLDVDVIDFDVMQDFNWCHTRLSLGGGISYAGLRMDRGSSGIYSVVPNLESFNEDRTINRFEGIGPTLTAELKRQIFESGFSLVGGVRGTVLFGRQKLQNNGVNERVSVESAELEAYSYANSSNVCRSIFAGWIGVQYDREILNGTDVFARLSWEGQYWNGFGSPMYVDSDLAFEGLGVAFGIRR